MARDQYVFCDDSTRFAARLPDQSIDLLLIDPPYYGIVKDSWDNQWKSVQEFVAWFIEVLRAYRPKLKPRASVVFFGGIGIHGERPFFDILSAIERPAVKLNLTYRNLITWQKRRAYGKSHDYLFCREEIAWYSCSPERTEVAFNIPLLDVKRGYAGFNPKYPAKSEFKRVSNVWNDIPELMKPERNCQKPLPLMDRLIQTHSNPGDLIVDCFAGWGSTGVAAVQNGRDFIGVEGIAGDAVSANERVKRGACDPTAFRKAPIASSPDASQATESDE